MRAFSAFELGAALFALAYFAKRKPGSAPQAWRNGKPVDVQLMAIDDKGNMLEVRAATAFIAMRAAAAAAGVPMVVESAFRTMEQQTLLWTAYMSGERTDPTAAPGYSPHQNGVAVDVTTARGTNATYHWLVRNAHLFGFKATVASEPWHWEHRA